MNAHLLAYKDFLFSLLAQIDAVESAGYGDFRRTRKELVGRVEEELRRIDEIKERVWERQSSSSELSSESEDVRDVEMESFDEEKATETIKKSEQTTCAQALLATLLTLLIDPSRSLLPLPPTPPPSSKLCRASTTPPFRREEKRARGSRHRCDRRFGP
jgi:hypothetical protein